VIGEEEPFDRYEPYDNLYEWRYGDRRAERRTKPKYATVSARKRDQILAEVAEGAEELELGFHPSYQPSRHEQGWLLSSLRGFYDLGLISDVLARVKGGKEANVYLCLGSSPSPSPFLDLGGTGRGIEGGCPPQATPSPQGEPLALLATKVYRPRMFRNLRNDALYRQGREIMVVGGKAAGKQATTIARAIRNKSGFGLEAAHTSWLMHEYMALDRLYRAGAAVPRPWGGNENAILMEMIGDERVAAPTLSSVSLGHREARRLLDEVLRNVELMLQNDLIHADLSPYNILYWHGRITLIDFPQVVHPSANPDARWILQRDLTRVNEYFAAHGADCNPPALAKEMWLRYVGEWESDEQQAALLLAAEQEYQ
jgi:RIO kinase 1